MNSLYGVRVTEIGQDWIVVRWVPFFKIVNKKIIFQGEPVKIQLDGRKTVGEFSVELLEIKGREVYQQAVRCIVEAVTDCLDKCKLTMDDVAMVISHQMNARIIESAAKRLKLPPEKCFLNINEYGNTSSASVPIAFDECARTHRIKKGDLVIFVAFGAGLTWGANVIQF